MSCPHKFTFLQGNRTSSMSLRLTNKRTIGITLLWLATFIFSVTTIDAQISPNLTGGIEWNADDTKIAYVSGDAIVVFDPLTEQYTEIDAGGDLPSFSWHPTIPNRVVVASVASSAKIWNTETNEILVFTEDHDKPIYDVQYNPTGEKLLISEIDYFTGRTFSNFIRVADAETGQTLLESQRIYSEIGSFDRVQWSPNSNKIAAIVDASYIAIFDASTGYVEGRIPEDTDAIFDFAWSPDGTVLAYHNGGKIAFWDALTYKILPVETDFALYEYIAWDSDNPFVIAGAEFGLYAIDPQTGTTTLLKDTSDLRGMSISRDGTRLAYGGYNISILQLTEILPVTLLLTPTPD